MNNVTMNNDIQYVSISFQLSKRKGDIGYKGYKVAVHFNILRNCQHYPKIVFHLVLVFISSVTNDHHPVMFT